MKIWTEQLDDPNATRVQLEWYQARLVFDVPRGGVLEIAKPKSEISRRCVLLVRDEKGVVLDAQAVDSKTGASIIVGVP